jgi:hypothetical protein
MVLLNSYFLFRLHSGSNNGFSNVYHKQNIRRIKGTHFLIATHVKIKVSNGTTGNRSTSKDQLVDTSYGINDYQGNFECSTAEAMKNYFKCD